jgi:HTH-type transcriptional regulator / antitoxin HigA
MGAPADDWSPAEAFPPGEYLADELEARGWTIAEFAAIIGRPTQVVSEIVNGKKRITAATATEIGAATETAPQTWLRLQDSYELWLLSRTEGAKLDAVTRRRKLNERVPLTEVKKRFPDLEDLSDLERFVTHTLLRVSSLEEAPRFAFSTRRSDDNTAPLSPAQAAWLGCVRVAAESLQAASFDGRRFASLAAEVSQTVDPDNIHALPARFAMVGVRLVYVPPFKSGKIDGAAFRDARGPVIALSGRYGQLDRVVFTLLHEAAHIFHGHIDEDAYHLDEELMNTEGCDASEREADDLAGQWALPDFPAVAAPVSRQTVLSLAAQMRVHPAIVVGRLHHEEVLPWKNLNDLRPNVRTSLERWPSC